MPRIRSIHPNACTSEKLPRVSGDAERCYWRLQTHCDDAGRCEDHPRLIWAALFPLHEDIGPKDVDGWLDELESAGLIVRYGAGGRRYLYVTEWDRFQHPQRPKASTIPEPSVNGTRRVPDEDATDMGGVLPGEGVGEGEGVTAGVPPKRTRAERDACFSALVDVFGEAKTKTTRGFYASVASELLDAGAEPDDVRIRGRALLAKGWPDCTPKALAKHWGRLEPAHFGPPDKERCPDCNGNGVMQQGTYDDGKPYWVDCHCREAANV